VTSPRLLLAAGSAAAALVGIVPVASHGAPASANPMRVTPGSTVTLVVPAGVARLSGVATGSPALADRARLTVTRASDRATLFTGSLASFRSLAVESGTKLVVSVERPGGFGGLRAGSALAWN
jgi:hypothetical protein